MLLTEGVRDYDYKLMAEDFEAQHELYPLKSKACFHSILSFHPDEKPSDEMMIEIAKKYLSELGVTDTQYAISKHTDKAHLHLHIVANMVNNKGKVITDSWIGLRGKKITLRLTEEYKLIPALKKDLKITNMQALGNKEANRYKIYIAISENLPYSRTLEELEQRLLRVGIETQYKYKGQTDIKQGISFKKDNISFKGSQIDRKYSFSGLQSVLQQQRNEKLKQQYQVKEIHLASFYKKKVSQEIGEDKSHDLSKEHRTKKIADLC